jgi:hypothetical protein
MELLVALVVSLILVTIIYSVYSRGAKTYRVQNMSLQMQAQARGALDHIRRDVANAGFNGTVNSSVDVNLCQKPVNEIRAITIGQTTSGLTPVLENPFVRPLSITLFGDFVGDGEVFYTNSIVGNVVSLQTSFQSTVSEGQFENMFTGENRRFLRIIDKDQYEMLIPVTGSNYDTGTITLETAPPVRSASQSCGVQGFGEGLEVNPANFIRYRVAQDKRPNAAPGKWDLIREEVQIDGTNAVEDTMLVISEYIVDLDIYDFVFDDDSTGMQPSMSFVRLSDDVLDSSGKGWLGTTSISRPQDLRFMTLKITVRTMDEDPSRVHQSRPALHKRIRSFDPDPTMEGAARTMTFTSRVLLQTLAVRNIKSGI